MDKMESERRIPDANLEFLVMSLATLKNKIDTRNKKKWFGFSRLTNVANSNTCCDKIDHDLKDAGRESHLP